VTVSNQYRNQFRPAVVSSETAAVTAAMFLCRRTDSLSDPAPIVTELNPR